MVDGVTVAMSVVGADRGWQRAWRARPTVVMVPVSGGFAYPGCVPAPFRRQPPNRADVDETDDAMVAFVDLRVGLVMGSRAQLVGGESKQTRDALLSHHPKRRAYLAS